MHVQRAVDRQGGLGACPPGNFWNFRRSEIDSGAFWDTCTSWKGINYTLLVYEWTFT